MWRSWSAAETRATVILDWFWAYLTYRRSTRLITGGISTRRHAWLEWQSAEIITHELAPEPDGEEILEDWSMTVFQAKRQ